MRHRRGEQLVPNTGVMLMRGSDLVRALLDEIWAATRLIDHPWWENAALLAAFGYDLPRALDPCAAAPSGSPRGCVRARSRSPGPSPYLERTQFLPPEWNASTRTARSIRGSSTSPASRSTSGCAR